jgi:hypothetical protein
MTDLGIAPESKQRPDRVRPAGLRRPVLASLLAATGGVVTAAILALVVYAWTPDSGIEANLTMVSPAEIAAAETTLAPTSSGQLVEQAKACTAPLAYVTIASMPGAAPAAIQIRSGDYISPSFTASATPQRIAIPFPAPYQTGHGEIAILGQAKDLRVSMFPTWQIDNLSGIDIKKVTWRTDKPC